MAKDKSTTEAETEVKVVKFKLSPKACVYRTNDGKINLNRLEGKTSASVSSDEPFTFREVLKSISIGTLIAISKDEKLVNEKDEIINVNSYAEDKAKVISDAISYLKKYSKEVLLTEINKIRDANLLAAMIEQESFGRNKSKRKREEVVIALKDRLSLVQQTQVKGTSMASYTEAVERPVEFNPQV